MSRLCLLRSVPSLVLRPGVHIVLALSLLLAAPFLAPLPAIPAALSGLCAPALACEPGRPFGSGSGSCGGLGSEAAAEPENSWKEGDRSRETAAAGCWSREANAWGRTGFSHLVSLNHNRANSECNPWLTADESEIFFIIQDGEYEPAQPGFQGDWDIYVSQKDPGTGLWGPATNLGPNINTSGPDRRPSTTATGDTLFFCRQAEILVSIRAGGVFGPATPILSGSDPAITADASQLYFVRNKDIWVADRGASIYEWTNQRSIGAPVNTAAAEVRPFVTADGSKLFFSDFGGIRTGGYGGSDIWVSTWSGTAWGAPVNFGPPVNTDRVTCTPFLNRDGTLFYTASESFEGSRGCEDIWVSYLDQSPAPQAVAPPPGTWTKLGELDGAWNVYDLVRGGDGALYAATMPDAVVFRSEDEGISWTPTSPLPNGIIAYSLLAASDGTLYAGTYPNGDVFRSTDGGQVWSPTSNLPASTAVRALLETSDGRILAGTSPLCRVYATTNRGLTWTQLGPTVAMESSVTRLFETSGGALLAGGWGRLNRSTNGGAQWAPASFPAAFAGEVMSIESFLEEDGAVWTTGWVHGHGGYVFRSTDGGASWDSTGTIRIGVKRAVRVYDIVGAPDGRLFIGLQPGPDQVALASADGGATWDVEGDLAGAHEVLRFLKTADGALFAATTPNGDVYRWTPGASGLPLDPAEPGSPGGPAVDPGTQAAARGVAAVLGGEPNPFTRSTTIRFQLPAAGYAHLSVADARGAILRRLAQGPMAAGEHAVVWDGRDDGGRKAPRGVYFVRLAAAGRVTWQKVVCAR